MAPDRGDLHVRDAYADMEISLADEPLPSQLVEEGTSQLEQHPSYNEAQRMLATRGSKPQNFTLRGVLLGLAIGIVICFSNTYFGLQTGWVSGMSMPSALIGFAFFKSVSSHIKLPFSPVENVLVQTVASSMGTMPLGCGFVGVVPALEYLLTTAENGPLNLGLGKLCLWAVGICLFGVVFAVPLRREVIIREKLKFPSGTATALMIGVLHGEKEDATILQQETARKHTSQEEEQQVSGGASQRGSPEQEMTVTASETELLDSNPNPARGVSGDWKAKIRLLTIAFAGSAFYVRTLHVEFQPPAKLMYTDNLLLFHTTSPTHSHLRPFPCPKLALDAESITCLRWPRYHHGPSHNFTHAAWRSRRLGYSLSPCKEEGLGSWSRERLE